MSGKTQTVNMLICVYVHIHFIDILAIICNNRPPATHVRQFAWAPHAAASLCAPNLNPLPRPLGRRQACLPDTERPDAKRVPPGAAKGRKWEQRDESPLFQRRRLPIVAAGAVLRCLSARLKTWLAVPANTPVSPGTGQKSGTAARSNHRRKRMPARCAAPDVTS